MSLRAGCYVYGWGIFFHCRYVKPPIFTLCVGNAWGEAALLLAAGAKGNRSALPSSTIMIKQVICDQWYLILFKGFYFILFIFLIFKNFYFKVIDFVKEGKKRYATLIDGKYTISNTLTCLFFPNVFAFCVCLVYPLHAGDVNNYLI